MPHPDSIRLNKYISDSGLCSRREADRFIEQGNVFINGKRAQIGDRLNPGATVIVNGNRIEPSENDGFVLIAFNKPVGVTSTTEKTVKNNIVDYVNHSSRIYPIGRLDKDSQGLIFLTNNGDIVNKILRAGNNHEKEYVVTVNKPITDAFLEGMHNGVDMLGVTTKKCKVEKVSTLVFKITLIQGLNRQIRRMCEHFKYDVVKLERIRIMNITLKGIPVGDWREFSAEEIAEITHTIRSSKSDSTRTSKATSSDKSSDSFEKPKSRESRGASGSSKPKKSNAAKGDGSTFVSKDKSKAERAYSKGRATPTGGRPKPTTAPRKGKGRRDR